MKICRIIHLVIVLLALLAASLACDLPSGTVTQDENSSATETMRALATRVAGTLEPDVESGGSGDSEDNSDEGSEAETTQASATPTITVTPTLGAPIVHVSVDTNCRFGPGDVYDYQGALLVGEESEVAGKLADESFWYIENPDAPPPYCWIWGAYAQVEGDTSGVPILTPPPTPTPEYTPTPELYAVSGIVFYDDNGNGLRDSGESGIANFQVDLREDDCGGTLMGSALTGANGQYNFSGIPPGTYWIHVYNDPGWCCGVTMATRPTTYTFELGPDRQFVFGFDCQ
jgi:hypothetical protein